MDNNVGVTAMADGDAVPYLDHDFDGWSWSKFYVLDWGTRCWYKGF